MNETRYMHIALITVVVLAVIVAFLLLLGAA